MSIRIDKEVKKFVHLYQTSKGTRYKVNVPDGSGGQIRSQGFLDHKSAMDYAKDEFLKVLLNKDKSVQSSIKIIFAEYVKLWLEAGERNGLAESTIRRYRDIINQFILPFMGSFKLDDLQKHHLRNFIQEMQLKGVSTYNVNSSVAIFKMIVKQAVEEDFMPMTNILTVRTPKHRAKDPRFWDFDEMKFFLNATASSKNHDIWKFVLYTGLRAGEVAALKWDCVHFTMKSSEHTGFLEIRRTCAQKSKKISERTKNGDRRTIPILPEIKDLLLRLKANATGEFVFGNQEPLETSHLNRLLQSELKKIPNLKKINFHGLRHTFCSYVDSTGMNRRIVSEIMGHRDLNTTNRYSHVSNQTLALEVTKWIEKQNQQQSNKVALVAL
jgi:integrase